MSTECKCSPQHKVPVCRHCTDKVMSSFTYTSVNETHGIIWAELREGHPADDGSVIEKHVYLRNKTITTPSKVPPIRICGNYLFIDVTVDRFRSLVQDARKLGVEIS